MAEQFSKNENHRSKLSTFKESIAKLKEKFLLQLDYPFLLAAVLNFAMLVIGCVNIQKCPLNKNIPIFLVVTGVTGVVAKITGYARKKLHVIEKRVICFETFLFIIETVFFLLGSYWVYKEFKPNYKQCNKIVYLFAFIYLTCVWICLSILIVVCCCALGCIICSERSSGKNGDLEAQSTSSQTP